MTQTWDVTLIPTDPDMPAAYVERRGAPTGEVTVRLQALDGTWEVCGADRAGGVWPENVKGIRADGWGSKAASFDLRRDPKATWPDIAAFTRVQIDIDGRLRWSGRVAQTPVRDDLDSVISVQCEGMQSHLDDDLFERVYVHTRLSDWKDGRSHLDANLADLTAAWQIDASGGVKISYPAGQAAGGSGLVYLDAGPGNAFKAVGWTASSTAWAANNALYVLGGDTFAGLGEENYAPGSISSGTSYTDSFTFTTPRRFVAFRIDSNSHTPGSDEWFKLEQIICVAESAYLSGLSSVLQADDIVLDALTRGTMLLSSDRTLVEAGTFNIPEFAPAEPRTPRQVWEAADAFEDRLKKIDLQDRAVYKAKPTTPRVEVGAWSAMSFEDASANDGSEVYSRVIVKGTQPDGQPLRVERRQADQPGAPIAVSADPYHANPTFAANTTGWTAGGSAITRDTGTYDSSPASGRWDASGASDALAIGDYLYTTFAGTFTKGITYSLDFQLRASATGTRVRAGFGASLNGGDGTVVADLAPGGVPTSFTGYRLSWTPTQDYAGSSVTFALRLDAGSAYFRVDSLALYSSASTIVERRRFQRAKTLDVNFTLTAAAATQLGDLWLRAHQRTPFKGTVRLTGHGAVRDIRTGTPLPVDALLDMTGELIRFADRIDPDTGAVGRDARIAEVSVDPDTEEATVTLDNSRAGFDALLARLDVVLGQNQSR